MSKAAEVCAICGDQLTEAARCDDCGAVAHPECLDMADPCRARERRAAARDPFSMDPYAEAGVEHRRVERERILKRLFSFLNLSIDDVVNDERLQRQVRQFFRAKKDSLRRGEQTRLQSEDAYREWLSRLGERHG